MSKTTHRNPRSPSVPYDVAETVLERDKKQRDALALLLDDQLTKNGLLLAHKAEMGGSLSYITSVTLDWIGTHVRFAQQLPLFAKKIDPETGKLVIDADTVDLVMQRPLDWSRQVVLAQYLALRNPHKFPALLLVQSRPWVDNPKSKEWGHNKQATQSTILFSPLDSRGEIGLLDLRNDVQLFALDGQHRLMGILGLIELVKKGQLQPTNKEGKPVGPPLTTADLKRRGLDPARLQTLPNEQIGIEVIAAVSPGETHDEARRRVRSIFVHTNRNAAPLSKGHLAQLDEDDGFPIVARMAAVSHPLLKDPAKKRVNTDSTTIATNSACLTTLATLQEMAQRYLSPKFAHWGPQEKGLVPMRPEDDELEEGAKLFAELLTHMAELPSYRALEAGATTGEYRRFEGEGNGGKGHMLFRPIGQIALAQALGELVFAREKPLSLNVIFKRLKKFDEKGGFEMEKPSSLWYMVLYDPQKKRMMVAGRDLAARLLAYLVGKEAIEAQESEALLADLATARTFQEQVIGFDGKHTQKLKLPASIT